MEDAAEQIILVDFEDREIGRADKLPAHVFGYLHRAISVFIFDADGRMLLQRRAAQKYHSGGLWTNACCSHPRPGESTPAAASRRLREELGIVCPLDWILRTHYRAEVSDALTENEVVHLFIGRNPGAVRPNPHEVEAYEWKARDELITEIAERPQAYTYWFKYYLQSHSNALFDRLGSSDGLDGLKGQP